MIPIRALIRTPFGLVIASFALLGLALPIHAQADGSDTLSVSLERAKTFSRGHLPKAEGLVSTPRQSPLPVRA